MGVYNGKLTPTVLPLCTQNLSKLVHAVHEKCIDLVAMIVISSLRCDGYDIVKFQEEKENLL